MNLEILQKEMISAMKAKDKARKDTISGLVQAVKKKGIDEGCRENIPESMVDEVLLKELKTIQEMIDTCPADRVDTLTSYMERKNVIEEFAPKILTDVEEIKTFINSLGIEISKANRGSIMKALKGKVDMKIANKVLVDMF